MRFRLYVNILLHPTPILHYFRKIFKENEKSQPLWLTFNDLYFALDMDFQRKILYLHIRHPISSLVH